MGCCSFNAQHQPSTYSVGHQLAAALSGAIISVSSGMHYGWPTPSLPKLLSDKSTITTNLSDTTWIFVTPFFGLLVGSFLAPALLDCIGRKMSLLVGSPVTFLAWLTIAFAPNAIVIECARFLAGIVDGLVLLALPIYISELAGKNVRGFFTSFAVVGFMLGVIAINAIGTHLNIQVTALIASIVPAVHFAIFIWMPESPYFLGTQKLRVDVEPSGSNGSEEVAPSRLNLGALSQLKDIVTRKSEKRGLQIALGLLLVKLCSGYLVMSFYYPRICVQVIVAILSGAIVDVVGRRPLLIISTVGASYGLAIESTYFYLLTNTDINPTTLSFMPLSALIQHTISFSIGLATVPQIIAAEIFPIRSKAICVSIINIVFALASIGVPKASLYVEVACGIHILFLLYGICCICGLIFIVYYVPETKRKTLEEIQTILRERNSNEDD